VKGTRGDYSEDGKISDEVQRGEKLLEAFESVSKPEDVQSQLVMSAEGGIRAGVFLDVPACPSRGSWRGFAFACVRGCSLIVVGVPVKLQRLTQREDLNRQPLVCRRLLVLSTCSNGLRAACTCTLFFT